MSRINKNNNYKNNLCLGDHLYYSCFNDNANVVKALVNTTKEALSPYHNFLNEAIKAEEKKGSYEIAWKYISSSYSLRVTPIYSKFKISKPKTIFRVYLDDIKIKETKNRLIYEEQDEMITFDKKNLKIINNYIDIDSDIFPKENEIISFNNEEIKYELITLELAQTNCLINNGNEYKIEKIEQLDNGWNIFLKTNDNLKSLTFNNQKLNVTKYQASFDKLYDEDDEFSYEKVSNVYNCEKLPKSKILKDENTNEYTWSEIKGNQQDISIQLIDDNNIDDEKLISEYFFSDEVREIYQGKNYNKNNSFVIKNKNSEDKILTLKKPWKETRKLINNENIKIRIDTGNLKKQNDAVKLLNNSPVKEQRNLIKLFEDKQRGGNWRTCNSKSIDSWYILDDENYDGTLDQRKFVEKAIATDDFAILEGPPGSGKTTTILELILQLVKNEKKILLSASTHVAIDNVLERIKQYDEDDLVEPLRIGREDSVGEDIQEYQIDRKIESYKKSGFSDELSQRLVIDSANLVCGTTMGINQFPPIKDRISFENNRRKETELPIDTMFDVMIIDESSKTTFQEFLVPAMTAKKWILVGDIKQLSPYIEQTHIVHNLNVSVPKDTQKAIRIIFETLYNNHNPYIVEVSSREENEIKKYLNAWMKKDNNPYKNKQISYSDEVDLFTLLGSDLILIKENSWEKRKRFMPKSHIIILKEEKDDDDFWFKQNYLHIKRRLPKYGKIDGKNSKINSVLEYKEFFIDMLKEQDWSETIAWRMIRVYERRMLKKRDSYYEKTYELLKPVEENNMVDRIYNMTLPSILESIQIGNGEKHKNRTTITEGFDKKDLRQRHEVLKTQHRMHPDISKFSREEFYTNEEGQALQNASTIDRTWKYNRFENRSVWIDTPKSDKDKNKDRIHRKEFEIILQEIKKFVEFSKTNPLNNDKKPWSIAILTFYRPQESIIRDELRKYCNLPNKMSKFQKEGIEILLYTVDKFQGMEADIVFLSMVRGKSIGFMDNINRLNVALTRAKYQRVIVGDRSFFRNQKQSKELEKLAQEKG